MHQMKKIMIMPIKSENSGGGDKQQSTITMECIMCHKQRKVTIEKMKTMKDATKCPHCGSTHASVMAGHNTVRR